MRKKCFQNYKTINSPNKKLTFLSFLHSVNLLRKLTKGGGGGGEVQFKKSPSKKTKLISQARHC